MPHSIILPFNLFWELLKILLLEIEFSLHYRRRTQHQKLMMLQVTQSQRHHPEMRGQRLAPPTLIMINHLWRDTRMTGNTWILLLLLILLYPHDVTLLFNVVKCLWNAILKQGRIFQKIWQVVLRKTGKKLHVFGLNSCQKPMKEQS